MHNFRLRPKYVEKAVDLWCQQIKSFVKELPSGFHKAIPKQVRLLKSQKKGVCIGDVEIFNTEAIYARIMRPITLGQTTLETALKHELSPVPTALFQDSGDMRFAKAKSTLKTSLEVQVSRSMHCSKGVVVKIFALSEQVDPLILNFLYLSNTIYTSL